MGSAFVRKLIAEFLGTFTLVFIGAFAVDVTGVAGAGANVVVPALAHGLVLIGAIYAYGHISGAHFNPAVTVGLLVGRKVNAVTAVAYIAAQFMGGIAAAVLLMALLPAPTNFGVTKGILTDSNIGQAVVIEAILTFFLVSAIFQAAVYNKAGSHAPLAIGFTLAACILAGGVYTGASLNPARTLGPALAAGDVAYVIPYFVGLFAGGALGGLVHSLLIPSKAS
jgi:aquaporin Z